MHFEDENALKEVSKALTGKSYDSYERLPGGYLHDTLKVTVDNKQYVCQRIGKVFQDSIDALIGNYLKIYEHFNGYKNLAVNLAAPLKFFDQEFLFEDSNNRLWRAFNFIDSKEVNDDILLTHMTGFAFGSYINCLSHFKGSLQETLPNFHNLRHRFDDYILAFNEFKPKLQFDEHKDLLIKANELATKNFSLVNYYEKLRTKIPLRFVHNDAKAANVLFEKNETKYKAYIIDIDTTFSGYSIVDFGDMFRSNATLIKEGEIQKRSNVIDKQRFKTLVDGYLKALNNLLVVQEVENLIFGAAWITFEVALRFLTDHLQGNHYFRVSYNGENLLRGYSQLIILEELLKEQNFLNDLIEYKVNEVTNIAPAP
jgi:hypothetical protein